MLDHIGVTVPDLARALGFYDLALAPLGLGRVMAFPDEGPAVSVGYGTAGKPFFWVSAGAAASGPIHVAFAAADPAAVRVFHAAGLAAGGVDNGAPGLRPQYHPRYYAAFLLDPEGNNVEAVSHAG